MLEFNGLLALYVHRESSQCLREAPLARLEYAQICRRCLVEAVAAAFWGPTHGQPPEAMTFHPEFVAVPLAAIEYVLMCAAGRNQVGSDHMKPEKRTEIISYQSIAGIICDRLMARMPHWQLKPFTANFANSLTMSWQIFESKIQPLGVNSITSSHIRSAVHTCQSVQISVLHILSMH